MACCKNWKNSIIQNHPECLRKFLKKKKTVTSLYFALKNGYFDCIHVFMEFNYEWPRCTGFTLAKAGRMDLLEYAYVHGLQMNEYDFIGACYNDSIELLKYLHDRGCPMSNSLLTIAIKRRKFEHIKYLREIGCPIDENTMISALGSHHNEYVKYLIEHGGKWYDGMYLYASYNLKSVKLLHELGCPWDSNSCSDISIRGKLKIIMYAHENGCPWNDHVFMDCARRGYLDCLKYIYKNGCPIGKKEDYVNSGIGTPECKAYIDSLFDKK